MGPSSYEWVDPDGQSCDSQLSTDENATGDRPDLGGVGRKVGPFGFAAVSASATVTLPHRRNLFSPAPVTGCDALVYLRLTSRSRLSAFFVDYCLRIC